MEKFENRIDPSLHKKEFDSMFNALYFKKFS